MEDGIGQHRVVGKVADVAEWNVQGVEAEVVTVMFVLVLAFVFVVGVASASVIVARAGAETEVAVAEVRGLLTQNEYDCSMVMRNEEMRGKKRTAHCPSLYNSPSLSGMSVEFRVVHTREPIAS